MTTGQAVELAAGAATKSELVVLRPCRHPTASCGGLELSFDLGRGGSIALAASAQRWTFATEVELESPAGPATALQLLDPSPRLVLLEEGRSRIGARSLHRLYSEDGVLRGEGMHEIWVTDAGEVFFAVCARVASPEPVVVRRAELVVATPSAHRLLDDSALVSGTPASELLVAWPLGRGRRNAGVRWDRTAPPFYDRWPSFFDQWSLDPETFGWDRSPSGGYGPHEDGFSLAWTREPLSPRREVDFRSLVFLSLGSADDSAARLVAHERPTALRLEGATNRGYEELDGAFVIVLRDRETRIEISAGPAPTRLRVSGLEAGERIDCEGPGDVLHTSERGRTDDPLVAVTRPAYAPADEAVITVAPRGEPVVLRLGRRPGLHVAYQRRDAARALTVHHPADVEQPICRVELETLRLRDLRLPGSDAPAIHDLPLFYARYLAKAPTHRADALESVDVVSDTEDLVALALRSATPDGGVRSTYELAFPARSDGSVEVSIETTLTGADRWLLPTFEFADVFPEDTIDPRHWDYTRLVLLAGGEIRSYDLRDPYPHLASLLETPAAALDAMLAAHGQPGYGPWTVDGAIGFVFFGSPRGTIVGHAETRTAGASSVATLCEHWLDLHLDVAFDAMPVASELGGEAAVSVSELGGRLSLLVVPREAGDIDASIELAAHRMTGTIST